MVPCRVQPISASHPLAPCPTPPLPSPLQTLHLTPQQKQQLLLQRQAHLTLMRRIYQQRQQLNMQVRAGSWGFSRAGSCPLPSCLLPGDS